MKILVLNCGSSSVKYQLFRMADESILAKGFVDQIGMDNSVLEHQAAGREKINFKVEMPDHFSAIRAVLETLIDPNYGVVRDLWEIRAVGHRIVHGGPNFSNSVLVDDKVVAELRRIIELAPLHNPAAIMGIEACHKQMPNVPMVVVFDTAFHRGMPPRNYLYGVPYKYYEKYSVRRYGFHGTSHRYVGMRAADMLGKPYEEAKTISCHLGNGASLCAIDGGRVLDTSMGFTPLAGLLMGTRCGDMDPAVVYYLMKKENLDAEGINNLLNKQSGLLGLSGVSNDIRPVTAAALAGNPRAMMAISVFVRQILHYIGAYYLELGGADSIVFTAGIGENSSLIRKKVCSQLAVIGAALDEEANLNACGETVISLPDSKVKIFVIPTNEELVIARDTLEIVYEKNMGLDRFF
ncbi:MAG: acetate kinase [Clostridia bacterium]|nr:acetate kinase [Clostridia bacterium]MDD4799004.1 acetate kinase [Clostridia bacterium]